MPQKLAVTILYGAGIPEEDFACDTIRKISNKFSSILVVNQKSLGKIINRK
ncbi:hypothetical protein [Virgibacillus alimentarius]|uniref:hypothetical protein n=1 Tax=Virgibacillus alimentarius TaxID=698769 RepID=UPI0012ECB769|nr:hypothetical protein [Virgibacillus alimentarius]